MAFFNQGIFIPQNADKYVGTFPITYRSSWELTLMNVCDNHPNIINWASESIEIPYQDPTTGKWRTYIPDFFIIYIDRNAKKHAELIEVKPLSQSLPSVAKSKKDQEAVILNTAKWQAAAAWCAANNVTFRIMTEAQIYANTASK